MNAARKPLTIADLRMEMVAKIAAAFGLIVVLASFAFSFAQLQWIAAALGAHPYWLSFLFPFIIDMPSVVASALTVALHDRPFRVRAYAWTILLIFTSLSWLCNAIHAVDKADRLVAIIPNYTLALVLVVLIAGIPPIGVVLGIHLWAYALRHSSGADQRAEAPVVTTKKPTNPTDTKTAEITTTTAPPPKVETTKPDTVETPASPSDEEVLVRAEFARRVEALKPGESIESIRASEIGKAVGVSVAVPQTVRRWVKALKDEHGPAVRPPVAESERAPELPRHAAPEPADEPVEIHERERVGAA